MELNQYIQGDAFELLGGITSESFDVVHIDPPYGKPNKGYGKTKDVNQVATRERRMIANDQNLWWLIDHNIAGELYRILKKDRFCVVWGTWETYDVIKTVFKMAGFELVTQGVWDKGVQGLGGDFCNTYEIWGIFKKGDAHANQRMIKNIISFQRLNGVRPDHPHAKPKQVLKKLLSYITPRGGSVLDCFAGSGSIAESCLELEYDYFCIELEQEHVDKALSKIKRYHDMQQLEFKPREDQVSS